MRGGTHNASCHAPTACDLACEGAYVQRRSTVGGGRVPQSGFGDLLVERAFVSNLSCWSRAKFGRVVGAVVRRVPIGVTDRR